MWLDVQNRNIDASAARFGLFRAGTLTKHHGPQDHKDYHLVNHRRCKMIVAADTCGDHDKADDDGTIDPRSNKVQQTGRRHSQWRKTVKLDMDKVGRAD